MAGFQNVDGKRYAAVGKCIYCGSTDDLTDEHTLPYGISGTAILPKSSCRQCATLTGKMEQEVLRGPMQQLRVFLNLKSRTKHKDAPRTKEYQIKRSDGTSEIIDVGFSEAPVTLAFPIYSLPGFLMPEGYEKGIRMIKGL